MKFFKSFMCVLCIIALYACQKHKNNYIPSQMGNDSIELNNQKLKISEDKANCFSIAYKKTSNGTKTIHVKLNDAASFDAIFDTGCSGMLISLQEAYNTPRFSDRHNYGGMTRNRYICKKEENQNGKTI